MLTKVIMKLSCICFAIQIAVFLSVQCVGAKLSYPKQNVLLILIDDLRPVLGCYGDKNAYTPHIDALAKHSALFTNAYAQQALCGPSRTSFLTSRSPHHLGQYDVHRYWRNSAGNFTSLPQFFRENGYHTASIGKIFHPGLCSNHSDDQPYSWSEAPYHPSTEKFKNAAVCPSPRGTGLWSNIVCPIDVRDQPGHTLPDIQSLRAAKFFLQRYSNGSSRKPFFLAVGFHKPHIPLKFPKKFLKHHPLYNVSLPKMRYRPPSLPPVAWNPWSDLRKRDDIKNLNVSFPWGTMPDKWSRLIKQSYYASVSYIDDLVGQLLSGLNSNKLQDNTIVLLTSDHGWSLSEHGEWSKYSNYEVSTRVPFIVSVPGKFSLRSNTLVELLDIFPTLTDLAGLGNKVPPCKNGFQELLCTDGKSLASIVTSGLSKKSHGLGSYSQYPRPGKFPTKLPDFDQPRLQEIRVMGYSIRTENHRYSEWIPFNPDTMKSNWTNVIATELYDHQIDPDENLNLGDRESLQFLRRDLSSKLRLRYLDSMSDI